MKKKVLAAIQFLLIVSIMSVKQLTAVKAIDPVALCQQWCPWSYMSTCTLHAGDSGGTYIITCYNREWI